MGKKVTYQPRQRPEREREEREQSLKKRRKERLELQKQIVWEKHAEGRKGEQKTDPVPEETHRNQDQEIEEKDTSVWDRWTDGRRACKCVRG